MKSNILFLVRNKDKRAFSALRQLIKFARYDDNIAMILLVGSYANGAARNGSDVDIRVICHNPEFFLRENAWIWRLGAKQILSIYKYRKSVNINVVFENSPIIEIGLASLKWINFPIDFDTNLSLKNGFIVLYKKYYVNFPRSQFVARQKKLHYCLIKRYILHGNYLCG